MPGVLNRPYDSILYDLAITVEGVWDAADRLFVSRDDYRLMDYQDVTGVTFTVTVWRNRVAGVLEMRDVQVAAAPLMDMDGE